MPKKSLSIRIPRIRSLRWKLTRNFTLTAAVVFFIVFAARTLAFVWAISREQQMNPLLVTGLAQIIHRDAAIFQNINSDPASFQTLLDEQKWPKDILLSNENIMGFLKIGLLSSTMRGPYLFVLDDQKIVRAVSDQAYSYLENPLPDNILNQSEDLIDQALNSAEPGQIFLRDNNTTIGAVPYSNSQGIVSGVVLIYLEPPSLLGLARLIVISAIPETILFTLVAALVGILFGTFFTRDIEKRVKNITSVTNAWETGQFGTRIVDHSDDELTSIAHELNHMAGELENLVETRQELAASEERNRLARDLHDSIKQQVFAISMNLAAIQNLWESEPEHAHEKLQVVTGLAVQTQEELAHLIHTLRPVHLEDLDLETALQKLVRGWEQQSGLTITTEIDLPVLPQADIQLEVYRIIQEALSNIVRHSQANRAKIILRTTGAEIYLQIVDNGRGFDTANTRKGVGLRSIQERTAIMGGWMDLQSSEHGVTLTVQAPLNQERL